MTFGWGCLLKPDDAVDEGYLAYMECPNYPCNATQDYGSKRDFAIEVDALSRPTNGPVSIEVYERDSAGGERPVFSLPLVLSGADKEISVKIVHAPYSELFGGDPHVHELEHSKLLYVDAYEIKRHYYFPRITHRGNVNRGDPYCTPLAQFLRRQ